MNLITVHSQEPIGEKTGKEVPVLDVAENPLRIMPGKTQTVKKGLQTQIELVPKPGVRKPNSGCGYG